MVGQSDERRGAIGALIIMVLLLASVFAAPAHAADKRIAFSYDDGPRADGPVFTGPERTKKLIKALKKGGVEQAVFYIETSNIKGETEAARVEAYARAGHVIANHTHSHQWLRRMGADAYIADIDKAESLLAGYDNRRPWFRFPYLDEGADIETRDTLRAALKERSLKNGYVTVDTYDWHMADLVKRAKAAGECVDLDAVGAIYVDMLVAAAEHYNAIALETLGRAPAQVMLMHENDLAALFADDLAAALRKAGWEIITADEAYQDDIAKTEPATLYLGEGRVAALANIAGVEPERLRHDANSETAINARFEADGAYACEAP